MGILAITYIVLGIVFIGISIPMLLRKVPRNPWYGLRIPLTLKDERIWYESNAYLARWLIFTGLVAIVVAVVGLLIPNLSLDSYAILTTVIIVGISIVGIVMSLRYAYSLR